MKAFQDKVIVITGGAGGIGRCIGEEFRKEGAHVCIIDQAPGDHYVGDIADQTTLEAFAQQVIDQYGRVDVLVNNAPPTFLGIDACSYGEFQRALAIGVTAPFYLSKLFAPYFSPGASIINISSVGGSVPDISQIAYGTSKAAINYLTKLIAVHEAKHKIRCNAVLPGMTATDAVKEKLSEDFRALFLKHIPLGRMGLPEEIASAVVYFASDDSAYTTGQILTVSGGFGLATPVYGDLKDRVDRR